MAQKTFIAGDVLTAADVNLYLAGEGGAWQTWTPSYTNFTLGNGTAVARYARYGRLIVFGVQVTLGSTSSVSGAIQVSLPVARAAYADLMTSGFVVTMNDATGSRYVGQSQDVDANNVQVNAVNAAGTYAVGETTTASVPFTWTTSDWWSCVGCYEAAT